MHVAGKRILVIGSQYGPEILWALRNGASHVVGLDPEGCAPDALWIALERLGLADRRGAFEMVAASTHDVGDVGTFDYVMSNNVFEHVYGLSHALASLRRFLPEPGARIVIFADPLFLSSQGHHLRAGSWEHLTMAQAELRASVPSRHWGAYRGELNGMTITSFLEAVREAGLILLDLGVVPDRDLVSFPAIWPKIPSGLKPMDLCLEGLVCTLAFPTNLPV
jgi:SAM-dependent methyltransferase